MKFTKWHSSCDGGKNDGVIPRIEMPGVMTLVTVIMMTAMIMMTTVMVMMMREGMETLVTLMMVVMMATITDDDHSYGYNIDNDGSDSNDGE